MKKNDTNLKLFFVGLVFAGSSVFSVGYTNNVHAAESNVSHHAAKPFDYTFGYSKNARKAAARTAHIKRPVTFHDPLDIIVTEIVDIIAPDRYHSRHFI